MERGTAPPIPPSPTPRVAALPPAAEMSSTPKPSPSLIYKSVNSTIQGLLSPSMPPSALFFSSSVSLSVGVCVGMNVTAVTIVHVLAVVRVWVSAAKG